MANDDFLNQPEIEGDKTSEQNASQVPPTLKKERYEPGKNLKTEFKLGYWIVRNKAHLKKILTWLLIAVCIVLWINVLIGVLDWALITGPKERANLKSTLDIKIDPGALDKIKAQPLDFGEVNIFAGGIGLYDIVVKVENINEKWWAEFEYRFIGEGLEGDWRKAFILPSEDKVIAYLGVERAFRPRNVRLETQNLKFQRIDNHKIPNYEIWKQERLNVSITEQKFDPNAFRDKKKIGKLTFNAKNETAYSFWDIGFFALLYRGDQLASVNYLSAPEFLSGEERSLQMFFYEGLPTISKVTIVPELNIFNEDEYIEQK